DGGGGSWKGDRELAEAGDVAAEVLGDPELDGEAAPTVDGGGEGLSADGEVDEFTEIGDLQAVAGEVVAARDDVDVDAAERALVEDAARARDLAQERLDARPGALDLRQVAAEHLDPDRRAHAG